MLQSKLNVNSRNVLPLGANSINNINSMYQTLHQHPTKNSVFLSGANTLTSDQKLPGLGEKRARTRERALPLHHLKIRHDSRKPDMVAQGQSSMANHMMQFPQSVPYESISSAAMLEHRTLRMLTKVE